MKVTPSFVPEDCPIFTVGKTYNAIPMSPPTKGYKVTNDLGYKCVIDIMHCAHLDGAHWNITEEEN